MKKLKIILPIVLVLAGAGAYIYWQTQKKKIVRNTIQNAVKKETDSLYYIHYDSSKIDELTGSASFYNVSLQSDSAQKALLESTDSLPNALYYIKVQEVKATGIDVVGLLQNQRMTASRIVLTRPVVQIINTGNDQPKPFTFDDTLALYKKILGKLKAIKAGNIEIINGNVVILNRKGKPLTTLENINISLDNFLIDSLHNYENIVSYFVKDVRATVENIQLPESGHKNRINIARFDYDAAKKAIHIGSIEQYERNNSDPLIRLSNINISQLNTDAFILNQQLKAGMITCDGGLITITKRNRSGKASNRQIELVSDFVEQAQIGGLKLGNTKIVIIDSAKKEKPFILNDVRFIVSKPMNVTEGTTIGNIISSSQWQLFSSGFTLSTKDKQYNIVAGPLQFDNTKSSISVKSILIKPLLSEAEFVKQSSHQRDRFDIAFNNIQLNGVDFKQLLNNNNSIEAENASLQTTLKIFNDRTLPPDTSSKVGNYPHQMLLKMGLPVYIKNLRVNNSSISYRERSVLSAEVGNTFFSNLNAVISNVTNIPGRISQNNICRLQATASFLGKANLSTRWDMDLNSKDGGFSVSGELAKMNAVDLNILSEPLALLSIKHGQVNKLVFSMSGNDLHTAGDIAFLYDDIKVSVLKKTEEDALKKRGAASFFANFLILNSNPKSGKTRDVDINYKRDIQRSFFNLLWKSVFDAATRISTGKK